MPGKIVVAAARWQRHSSDANRLCCAISAKSAEIPPAIRADLIPTDSAVRVRPPQPRSRSLRRRRPSRSLCLKSPVRETGPRGLWSDVFRVLALDRAPTVRLAMLWLNCRDGRRHRIREPSVLGDPNCNSLRTPLYTRRSRFSLLGCRPPGLSHNTPNPDL
jgi:hypothetical protein